MLRITAALAATVLFCSSTNAALMIELVPSGADTVVTFSGSSTIVVSDPVSGISQIGEAGFQSPSTLQFEGFIANMPMDIDDLLVTASSSTAEITVNGLTSNITQLFLDFDGDAVGDDFGIRVDSFLPSNTGDAVSWTGSLTVPVSFSSFNPGVYTTTDAGQFAGPESDRAVLTVIPEPASLALLAVGGVALLRRRR